ncbi:MAG: 23S rRNA (guanosine(2251)-2'-O)-methyltransferase RlmB [Prevotellaceae bacterium]|jgi:23S rRNA (guanosine2251-2'-O)-methyltransferase|nr:23S rRNA (guanosine(2251)-2'-O)-methyltransferase RlmB [Prevotellaceae bacterium]
MENKENKENNKIFGLRPVLETLKANRPVEKIMIRETLRSMSGSDLLRQIASEAKAKGIALQYVPEERLDRLAKNGNHQGIVAFPATAEYSDLETVLEDLQQRAVPPLLLLLDGITDVRNFGAIVRTAECAGVHAVVVPAKGAAPMNADAMKTSAGALNHVPVCRVPSLKTAALLAKSYGLKIAAATEKTGTVYYEANLAAPLALIAGSEESGISKNNLALADECVKIPLHGKIDSLNVSAAAAIILFESVRQKLQ